MKKALRLAIIYLFCLIVGTVLGTVLYSLYLNLLNFIAGHDISFFSDQELFNSFFYVLFCMLLFIIPAISYYRIRHPGGIMQFVVYVVLCVVTWLIIMPCAVKLQNYCLKHVHFTEKEEYLSANYFRKVDDSIYYFTREFERAEDENYAKAPAVVINTKEDGIVSYDTVLNLPGFDLNRKAAPYREIQLKNIFGSERNPIPIDFKTLISHICDSYSGGRKHILLLLSFVLLLSSLYGVTTFFEWRLVNAIIIFISDSSILCFNSIYFHPEYDALKASFSNNGAIRALGNVVHEPLLFLINCFVALIFITAGVIRFVIRIYSKKAK
ncbi:MAG: hypothetical protein J6X84_05720 [Treponema sp.]|nr:hypothetical protein [Treponema sp.]